MKRSDKTENENYNRKVTFFIFSANKRARFDHYYLHISRAKGSLFALSAFLNLRRCSPRIYVLQSTFTRSHAPFEANTHTRTRIAVHGRSILFRFFQSRLSIVRHKRLVPLLRYCTGTFDSTENSSRNKLPI